MYQSNLALAKLMKLYFNNKIVPWLVLFMFGICLSGAAHAASTLDAWRGEVAATRQLSENDVSHAYEEAQRMQASMPGEATAEDKARMLNLLSRIELYLGLTGKSAQHSAEAKVIAIQNNDRVGQVEADLVISLSAINQGRLDDMVEANQDGMGLLVGLKREDLRAEAMFHAAMMYLRFGHLDEAVTVIMRSLEVAKNSNNPLVRTYAEQGMAVSYAQSGRHAEAREHYQRMLEAARQAHSTLLEATALLGLGGITANMGDAAGGERQCRKAIALFRRVGGPFYVSHALFQLADQRIRNKQPAKALLLLDEDVAIYEKYANPIGLWWTLNERSTALQALGRLDAARGDAERANDLARKIGFTVYLAGSARRLADVAAAQGKFERAYRWSAQAAELNARRESEKSGKRILDLAQRFQDESKQRQVDELTRHNEQQDARQRWLWTVLGSSLVLLVVTAVFLLRLRHSNRMLKVLNMQVQRSQNKLQATLDAVPDLLFELGQDGSCYEYHSPRTDLLAAPAEAFLGKTVSDILPFEAADICMSALREAHEKGTSTGKQFELLLPHGKSWFELSVARKSRGQEEEPRFIVLSRDITERKRMEQSILIREAELRSVTDSSPYYIIRYDLDGRITYANAPLLKYFCINLSELLGKLPCEVWPDGRYAEIDRGIASVREKEQSVVVEFSETTAGGEILYYQIWVVPERGASGEVLGFIAFGLDITGRRSAERELHLLNRALDNSFDATYLLDTDLRFLYVNEAAARALGFSCEELLSLTLPDIAPNVTREMVQGLMAQTAVTGYFPGVVESRHRRKNGETFPIEVGASTFRYEDETLFLTVVRDITERKRMEAALRTRELEFRSLAENSPDIIMRYDLECRRTYVNPAYERDVEIPSDAVLSVIPDARLWRSANMSVDEYKAWLRQVMANGEVQERIVEWIRASDGAISYFAVRMVAERDADGRKVGVLAIGRNITEHKQAEQLLEESRTQLRGLTARREEAREEERKYIAREVHDELGQILTGLQLNVSVLEHKFAAGSPPLREHLKETMMLTDKALGVARNVASALRPAALDMGIVSALEWLAGRFGSNTGIRCEVHIEDKDIQLDENLAIALFRIVQESLTNVARHARADRIDIVLGRVGDDCSLKVRDNGSGFDLRATKKMDSFGLVGMRERALLLGGEVIINSRPGEGTEVEVHIPAHNISRAL